MIINKDIGIKKDSGFIIPVFLIINISLLVATIVFWWFYIDEYDFAYLVENGVEIEATVVDYDYHSESYADGDADYLSGWYYIWECHYNGRTYSGIGPNGYLRTQEEVMEYLGKNFTVTVDPNSNWVVDKPIAEIRPYGLKFEFFITGAISFSIIFPIVLLSTFIIMLYPMILNNKIDKTAKLPILGEVIKVFGFLWFYIKVKYKDENNEIQEKWAKAYFTRKEAQYLKNKKYINIVLYKKTYGILEEMPIEKKRPKKYDA